MTIVSFFLQRPAHSVHHLKLSDPLLTRHEYWYKGPFGTPRAGNTIQQELENTHKLTPGSITHYSLASVPSAGAADDGKSMYIILDQLDT